MQAGGRKDGILEECLQQRDFDHEAVTIESVLKKCDLCERQLERKFNVTVGVFPNTYQRIIRFEKAMHQLRCYTLGKLQDVALGLN